MRPGLFLWRTSVDPGLPGLLVFARVQESDGTSEHTGASSSRGIGGTNRATRGRATLSKVSLHLCCGSLITHRGACMGEAFGPSLAIVGVAAVIGGLILAAQCTEVTWDWWFQSCAAYGYGAPGLLIALAGVILLIIRPLIVAWAEDRELLASK